MNAAAAWVPGLGPLESAIMTVICLDRAKCPGKARASLMVRGPHQPTEEAQ